MKKLLNKLLFGQSYFKEYPAVTIEEKAIEERVFFEIEGAQFDVSQKHWLLSLEPMVFGIWIDNTMPTINEKTNCKLYFNTKENKTVAGISLKFKENIVEKEGILFLFSVEKNTIFYLNTPKIYLIYLLYYKKPNQSFTQFKNLVAAFSYPRKVKLISFKKEDYFNIFPMDLVGTILNENWFVFGLRHTNSTLDKIVEDKKIVAVEFSATLKKDVYKLSKHHSSNPPDLDSLPFKVISTQEYNFPIPTSAVKYDEIQIIKSLNLGSHMLLWGKTINTISVNEKENNLYHIHFLNYLNDSSYNLA